MQRSHWSLILKFVFAGIIFWYLYATIDWTKFGRLIAKSDSRWLAAAFIAYGITTALGVFRWHILLTAFHAPMRLMRTAQLSMIGLFANCFLPGMMCGDVFKIYYATKELPNDKTTVVMSIVMERILGFIAMFAVSTTLILSRYNALTGEVATRWAVYLYFGTLGAIVIIVLLGAWRGASKFLPFRDKIPWQQTINDAVEAYRFFMSHKGCFWGGLAISAVAHFSLMMTFYFVSQALRMELLFWDLAAVLPLVNIVTLVPLTINGIGVREVAFKHFLVFAGMTKEASVALSLGGFFVILIWNLLGGLVYLQFRSKEHGKDEMPNGIDASPNKS